jgi:hypothetical protein
MNEYKPYRCSCCQRHLAVTNGVRLVFGEAWTDEPIPIRCAACGKRSYWRPVQKIDNAVTNAYTDLVPA